MNINEKGLAPATKHEPGLPTKKLKQNDTPVCPFCKQTIQHEVPQYLLFLDWLNELEMLINRYSHLGITADISSMTLPQLWGLYHYLKGLGM